jgi:ankyrin repeat protein
MHVFRYFIFALLVSIQPSVFAMDQASSASLPDEVWKQILEWANFQEDAIRLEHARTKEKLLSVVRSINNLVRHSRICKATYRASASLITSYLQWSADHLKLENMHSLLHSAITKWDYKQKKLAPLYRKLGADINHIHQDGDTLVTYAIKHENKELFERLVKMRTDLMQPNRRGQVPIDLAYDMGSKIAVLLKDNGGDPENRYEYWADDDLLPKTGGRYKNYQPKKKPIVLPNYILQQQPARMMQQNQAASAMHGTDDYIPASLLTQQPRAMEQIAPLLAQQPIPVVDRAQNLTAATHKAWSAGFTRGCITGIAACCIGYWIYSTCYGTDDEQAEDEQDNKSKPVFVTS